jgi:hypothetical protein
VAFLVLSISLSGDCPLHPAICKPEVPLYMFYKTVTLYMFYKSVTLCRHPFYRLCQTKISARMDPRWVGKDGEREATSDGEGEGGAGEDGSTESKGEG